MPRIIPSIRAWSICSRRRASRGTRDMGWPVKGALSAVYASRRGDLTATATRATTRPERNSMSFNTFGHLFRVTTFGESHGLAIGCVVDGCPPRIPLTEADIQPYLDKRRPGQSRFTTQRHEPVEVAERGIERARGNWDEIGRNPFFCQDAEKAKSFEGYLDDIRKRGSSVGAVIEVVAESVPVGLGAPIYGKLDGDLAAALMGINAVKGVEIGAGFAAAALSGEENADEIRIGNDGRPVFLSNHAGGVLGGISTGQPIVCRFAVKPTSSILTPRRTVDRYGAETDISTRGRHDPCVGIRAVPIGEAMVACVIADHYLRQRGQICETPVWPFSRA